MFAVIRKSEWPSHSWTSFNVKPLAIKSLHMNVWGHENGYAEDCTFSKALKTCSLYNRGHKVFRQPTWKYNHSGSIFCQIKLYFPSRGFSASLKAVRHLPHGICAKAWRSFCWILFNNIEVSDNGMLDCDTFLFKVYAAPFQAENFTSSQSVYHGQVNPKGKEARLWQR